MKKQFLVASIGIMFFAGAIIADDSRDLVPLDVRFLMAFRDMHSVAQAICADQAADIRQNIKNGKDVDNKMDTFTSLCAFDASLFAGLKDALSETMELVAQESKNAEEEKVQNDVLPIKKLDVFSSDDEEIIATNETNVKIELNEEKSSVFEEENTTNESSELEPV
jgi:hypothetical protein